MGDGRALQPDPVPCDHVTGQTGEKLLIVVFASLTAFSPMSVDMYLPSLPTVAREFGTNAAGADLTLGSFFIGFGVGQLVYGPLADCFGRRGPLLAGLLLFIAASVACALTGDLAALVAARFLQALGGAAGPVVVRAMVRDLYVRDQAARVLSWMVVIMGVAPLFAPLLGGQMLHFFGWRAIFWFLTFFSGTCLLATALIVSETLPRERRSPAVAHHIARSYALLLRRPRFFGYAISGAFAYGGLFAYLAGSPFVFITLYGIPAERYGLIFGLNTLGLLGAAAVNGRLVTRLGAPRMMTYGTFALALFGCGLASMAAADFGELPVLLLLFLFIASLGFVIANGMACCLELFPDNAGVASATTGALQFGMGGVAVAAVAALSDGTSLPMGGVIAIAGVMSLVAKALTLPGDMRAV